MDITRPGPDGGVIMNSFLLPISQKKFVYVRVIEPHL